jgi:hypothetical protein
MRVGDLVFFKKFLLNALITDRGVWQYSIWLLDQCKYKHGTNDDNVRLKRVPEINNVLKKVVGLVTCNLYFCYQTKMLYTPCFPMRAKYPTCVAVLGLETSASWKVQIMKHIIT